MTRPYNVINKIKQSNTFRMRNWKNWKHIILSTGNSFHMCNIISILKINVDTAEVSSAMFLTDT
jgi:hypothetical protein